MNVSGTNGLKVALFVFALTGGYAVARAVPASGSTAGAAVRPAHSIHVLPAALRPVFYRALAKDAESSYTIGKNGCVVLPTQTLRACFDSAGAHFSGADPATLSLRLVAYGRGSDIAPVTPVRPETKGNRVNYSHGALSEWWQVLPSGFEQGFTVTKRAAGHGQLVFALAASDKANWQDVGASDGALAWGRLHYGGLVVTDAKGEVVPAMFKSEGDRILIVVNDAQAAYPLTVDPMVWLTQKVIASDGAAGDVFGNAVAVSGTTALISAPAAAINGNTDQGAVYVFTESNGVWSQESKLTASDGAAGDYFGVSAVFAGDGTIAFVGAFNADVSGNTDQGAVYVFTDTDDTWTQTQKLTASDGASGDYFGQSIGVDGTTAFIGAPNAASGANTGQGAAYVFADVDSTWTQTQKLTASDGMTDEGFGNAVAVSGTTALVGTYDDVFPFDQGAAYVFTDVEGTWTQTQKLTASDGVSNDCFGYSVALLGTTALIGAFHASVNGTANQGAAYVFDDSNGTWTQTQKLAASDGAAGDAFGKSVVLEGTTALAGAPDAGNQPIQDHPDAAYLFTGSGGIWSETQKFTAVYYHFGYSLAISGANILIGSRGDTGNGNVHQGAAYFYGGSDLDLTVSAPGTVGAGQNYVSQTIVTNSASVISPAVAVTVTVPAMTSFISANATQGNCSKVSEVVSCNFGQINGNAGTASANVTLKAIGGIGTIIKNTTSLAEAVPPLAATAATVIADNPPVAQDGTLTTTENTAASGTLIASDPDGDALTYSIVTQPA
ncbi:MAG: hypothetical protein ACRES7_11555, partial [Gammaproteobacteria bacterium]